MSTPTPRPWAIGESRGIEDFVTHRHIEGPDGGAIARMYPRQPNDQANARLIAAAPDLLTALRLADATLRRFENCEKPYQGDDEGEEIYATIAAAIAKAEIQQPQEA